MEPKNREKQRERETGRERERERGERLQGRMKGRRRETAAISAKSRSIEISAGIASSVERTRMETGGQRRAMQHHLSQ